MPRGSPGIGDVVVAEGAPARAFEPSRPKLVRELENAEHGAQAIERTLAEQPADQLAGGGPDVAGAADAAGGRGEQPGHFGRGIQNGGDPQVESRTGRFP